MKIITVLRSLKCGGAERHALQLMRGLRERGHEALYAGPMAGWLGQQLQADGFDGIDLPLRGLIDLPSIWRLARYARDVKADLIHGHLTRGAYYAGYAARLAGLPNVVTAHSDNAGKHFGHADRIIAVSQAVADFLQRCGYDPRRIRMVHHGIASCLQPDMREATRHKLGLSADEPCLLMAARIVPAKGHDTALRALAMLKPRNWTLLLAGDHHGDLGPQMQALARELGITDRVRFLGLREDVPALLAASDLLLAPSRREALSLTLLEASACCLPIVASRVGGIGEVVQDGVSGILVPPDAPEALAAALSELLDDKSRRQAMGACARQHFETCFTENLMFDQTEAVYREACKLPAR
jgi:glycosyltransferase involved in cell wall biosynthesis